MRLAVLTLVLLVLVASPSDCQEDAGSGSNGPGFLAAIKQTWGVVKNTAKRLLDQAKNMFTRMRGSDFGQTVEELGVSLKDIWEPQLRDMVNQNKILEILNRYSEQAMDFLKKYLPNDQINKVKDTLQKIVDTANVHGDNLRGAVDSLMKTLSRSIKSLPAEAEEPYRKVLQGYSDMGKELQKMIQNGQDTNTKEK